KAIAAPRAPGANAERMNGDPCAFHFRAALEGAVVEAEVTSLHRPRSGLFVVVERFQTILLGELRETRSILPPVFAVDADLVTARGATYEKVEVTEVVG